MKVFRSRYAVYIVGILITAITIWLVSARHTDTIPSGDAAAIEQLPLVELQASPDSGDTFAIILSGDGGWADLDRDFGKAFQLRGLSTVGFDCLKYFWKPRQPAEVSQDLETAIRFYLATWHKKQVLLVGYSFGADWLPFLVNRLPADLQEKVRQVVLLAPGDIANLEIKVGDWLRDVKRPGALDVAPEASLIKLPLLCVYGVEDGSRSICGNLKSPKLQILRMPGGHHFDNQYATIEDIILRSVASK